MDTKIIVVGASGVGKTTLVEALAPLLHLSAIPEVARDLCKEMGYERIGDIPQQEAFKFEVLDRQIQAENKLKSFLSDRSTVDSWVLWQRWNICQAMSYDTERYYNKARAQAEHYTHVIYIPAMFDPSEDGFRWTDLDYQKQIDRLVRMTLYDFGLWDKTYTVKSDTVAERIKETQAWIAG